MVPACTYYSCSARSLSTVTLQAPTCAEADCEVATLRLRSTAARLSARDAIVGASPKARMPTGLGSGIGGADARLHFCSGFEANFQSSLDRYSIGKSSQDRLAIKR